MTRSSFRKAWYGLFALGLLATPSALWISAAGSEGGAPSSVSFERGAKLFSEATFGGNGRTCATCHEPLNEFTISPELVQARFAKDPTGPLFRPIDSNDGAGLDYSNLLNHALVTVRVALHENVTQTADPANRTITVWRGTPTIANVALTAPYLHDGSSTTLQDQAAGAITNHMEPGRQAGKHELDSIARFQEQTFYPLRMRALMNPNETADLQPGFSIPVTGAAPLRGRDLFDQHCSRCHAVELGHRPELPGLPIFVRTFVSDANRLGLPVLTLTFRKPDGTTETVQTPDPGRAARTGDLADLNMFEIPMLRGVKHTAPYFHDNSANTLSAVIAHYNEFFGFGIRGEDRDDLVSFLELL